jgi:aquaporin-8
MSDTEQKTENIQMDKTSEKEVLVENGNAPAVDAVDSPLPNHYYWKHVRPMAAEFFSSMILVYNICSCAAGCNYSATVPFNATQMGAAHDMAMMPAFTAGLSIFALLTVFNYIATAHISPTVTFGFALAGLFDFKWVIPYVVTQVLGAICGAALAMASAGHGSVVGVVDLTGLGSEHVGHVLVSEMQVSFFLAFATCMVMGNSKWELPVATLMIGVTVFTGTLAGFMAAAGVMNPARALAPAILSNNFAFHWIWWVGSMLGAIQCCLIYRTFFAPENLLFPFVRNFYKTGSFLN